MKSEELDEAIRYILKSLNPMPYYYLDSKGLHTANSLPLTLELGTIIYSPNYGSIFRVVSRFNGKGEWRTERAHTKHIQRMKLALLIEGVSIN